MPNYLFLGGPADGKMTYVQEGLAEIKYIESETSNVKLAPLNQLEVARPDREVHYYYRYTIATAVPGGKDYVYGHSSLNSKGVEKALRKYKREHGKAWDGNEFNVAADYLEETQGFPNVVQFLRDVAVSAKFAVVDNETYQQFLKWRRDNIISNTRENAVGDIPLDLLQRPPSEMLEEWKTPINSLDYKD